jgi:hypothetical protein
MATKTWNQTSGNLASTDANWVGGVKPVAGDDIVLDGTSVANMTQDLVLTFGSYSQNAGYSGVVTVAASTDWGTTGDIKIAAGTLTSVLTSTITCGGDLIYSGGTITANLLKLIMTKNGGVMIFVGRVYMPALTVNDNTTLSASSTGSPYVVSLIVALAKTLTLNYEMTCYDRGGALAYSNLGTITGSAGFRILFRGSTAKNIVFGTVNCYVTILGDSDVNMTADATLTLTADAIIGGVLTVNGGTQTKTITLDTSASNYRLSSAGAIIMGARGIVNGRASKITSTGYTQNGANSVFTQGGILIVEGPANVSNGTWAVNENATVDDLTQSGGTITVAAGKILYYEKTLSQTGGSSSGTIAQFQARKQPPIQPAARRPVDVTHL